MNESRPVLSGSTALLHADDAGAADAIHRAGLRRLAGATLTFAVLVAATYVVPGLSAWRPWIPGDPLPFAGMFGLGGEGDSALAAGAGAAAVVPWDEPEVVPSVAAAPLPAAPGTAPLPQAPPASAVSPGVRVAEGRDGAASGGAAKEPGGSGPEPTSERAVLVPPSPREWEGLTAHLEGAAGALDRFYAKLAAVQGGEPIVARIAHYGDSTIATDGITGTVRRLLQRRFGDAGHGFVAAARHALPYFHVGIEHSDRGWKLASVTRGARKDGRYGYGGLLASSWGGARMRVATASKGDVGTRVSLVDIAYQAHPAGGVLQVRVDDADARSIQTRAERTEDRWERIELPDGPHEVVIRAAGKGLVRLYGVSFERSGPGVIYDSLGLVGARADRLLHFDVDHWAAQFRHAGVDLVVLQFGGNEAVDRHMRLSWYRKRLRRVVRALRKAAPQADCLLMAPLDQAGRDARGRIRTKPIVPKIVAIQREVATEEGCAFWNTFEAMGGPGSMRRWYRARPKLAWGDFIHATPAGYNRIGQLFYKALIEGYARYLSRASHP